MHDPLWSKETPPPGGVSGFFSYLLCSFIKNREWEDPPRRTWVCESLSLCTRHTHTHNKRHFTFYRSGHVPFPSQQIWNFAFSEFQTRSISPSTDVEIQLVWDSDSPYFPISVTEIRFLRILDMSTSHPNRFGNSPFLTCGHDPLSTKSVTHVHVVRGPDMSIFNPTDWEILFSEVQTCPVSPHTDQQIHFP